MKRIIFAFFATAMILVCSCKKILDTKPKDFVTTANFPNNANDATKMLNYGFFLLHKQYVFDGYWVCRAQAGDDVWCSLTGTNYPGTFTITATESTFIPTFWNTMYSVIEQVNTLIKYLPNVPMDQATRNALQGEALFLRGMCYFYLVDQWGAVPLRTEPTGGANDLNIARTPVADVYKQILADLTAAEPLVPDASNAAYGGAGYPPKTAVEGLLARVCLTMAGHPLMDVSKYADAKMWCAKVIASGLHSLNPSYIQFFSNLATGVFDKKESIWEIDMVDQTGVSGFGTLGFLDGIPSTNLTYGIADGQVRCMAHLYNLYAAGTTSPDMRRDWIIAPFVYKTPAAPDINQITLVASNVLYGRYEAKYRSYLTPLPHVNGNSPVNFPMMRYADILLMYAEADNQVNGGPSALDYTYVNMVRARAYGKLLPGATNLTQGDVAQTYNKDTFQQLIIDERCREFPAEGLRKHDLIRWGIYISTIKAMASEAAGSPAADSQKQYVVRWQTQAQDKDVLWPIPANELTYNKLMTQNPGW